MKKKYKCFLCGKLCDAENCVAYGPAVHACVKCANQLEGIRPESEVQK